jgi:ABC-2 type transport system permease protein
MTFLIVLRKELTEHWRTKRFLIVAAILTVFGLTSPLLAKFTPELLKTIPNVPAAVAALIPTPSVADAVGQYVKNMGQFGVLLALLMTMGVVAQEKERGTAAMMLTHPVSRLNFLLAKFMALGIMFAVSLAVAAVGCWYYTTLLFAALPLGPYLALNGLILVIFLVYISVTLLCSTLVRTQGAAAGLAFAALIVIAGIGSLPRIGDYFPGRLFSWGASLALGGTETAWPAFGISLGIIAAALIVAFLVFHRQEV